MGDLDIPSQAEKQSIPADVLKEASKKYSDLVDQLADYQRKRGVIVPNDKTQMMYDSYAMRPRDCDHAKNVALSLLFGGYSGPNPSGQEEEQQDVSLKDVKVSARAEGNVGDMFAEATGVYEEGLAGACNRALAMVVATLVRKHG